MRNFKHTSGPLRVRQNAKWPFDIEIVDSENNVVLSERREVISSQQTSVEDCMRGQGFKPEQRERAIAANERQLADAYLRAAAPELLEILIEVVADAEDYEHRTGKKITGWLEKARSALDRVEVHITR